MHRGISIQAQPNKKFRGRSSAFFVAVLLGAVLLTGIISNQIITVLVLFASVGLFLADEIHMGFPVMIFYNSTLSLLAGISAYRWFSILFLVAAFLRHRDVKISGKQLLVLFLYAVYCVVVFGPLGLRRSLFAILDMLMILALVNCYLCHQEKLKSFFSVHVFCSFAAYFTGMHREGLQASVVVGGKVVAMARNMATFEDPNYMGFFYTVAIFAVVGLKLFDPKLRWGLVIALYAILLTSLSVTAVVVNAVLWLLYLVITKRVNAKGLFVFVLVLLLILGLYRYGLQNPDIPVVGDLALRLEEKMMQARNGDFVGATSSRSSLAAKHMQYFWGQPVYKMLIGMNPANTMYTNLGGYTAPAHNEYVDWLLNVGILGTIIMSYYLISTTYRPLIIYRRNMTNRTALTVVMIKLVFAIYACTLTLYTDYRFMLFFLI